MLRKAKAKGKVYPYTLVTIEEEFKEMYRAVADADYISFDIETRGLNPYAEYPLIATLSVTTNEWDTYVLPLAHPQSPWGIKWKELLHKLQCWGMSQTKHVAHNAPFDNNWVRRVTGVDTTDRVIWDTMNGAHILDEEGSKKLKVLCHSEFGDWAIDTNDCMKQPLFELADYNAIDTIATMWLMQRQVRAFNQTPSLWDTMKRTTEGSVTLMRASFEGILLDSKQATKMLAVYEQQIADQESKLLEYARRYGLDPDEKTPRGKSKWYISWAATALWFKEFARHAVEEGDLIVLEHTKRGNPSWRKGLLYILEAKGYPLASILAEHRFALKRAEFLRSWFDKADSDGRIHPNWNTARTRTGRLSSSNPNMQQVAYELKPAFWVPKGDWFMEIDHSQAELRVMAEFIHRFVLPNNPMIKAYQDDLDLHSINASLVTGGDPADVTKAERDKGKAVGLGYLFGMFEESFIVYARETFGVSFTYEESEKVRTGYFNRWAGLQEMHEYLVRTAYKQGYIENLLGRRRRLPAIYSNSFRESSHAERQALNAPIQSTAWDFLLYSLIQIERQVPRHKARTIGSVHDSALFHVSDLDMVDRIGTLLLQPPVEITVPLAIDISIGPRWGQYDTTLTMSTNTETQETRHD